MATAYAARRLGIPATIVVPSTTPALTIERLKNEGAMVKVVGEVSACLPAQGRGLRQCLGTLKPHPSVSLPYDPADAGRGLRAGQSLSEEQPGLGLHPTI